MGGPQVNQSWRNVVKLSVPVPRRLANANTYKNIKIVLRVALNYCKVLIVFKTNRRLLNLLWFKGQIPNNLVPGIVYKICERCKFFYHGDRYALEIRSSEYIAFLSLTFKKEKPSVMTSVGNHLLICHCSPPFGKFSVLACSSNKYVMWSLLISLDDHPPLNRHSAKHDKQTGRLPEKPTLSEPLISHPYIKSKTLSKLFLVFSCTLFYCPYD